MDKKDKKEYAAKFQNLCLFFAIVIIPFLVYYYEWNLGIPQLLLFGVGMFFLGNNAATANIEELEEKVKRLEGPGTEFAIGENVIVNGFVDKNDNPGIIIDDTDKNESKSKEYILIYFAKCLIIGKNDDSYLIRLNKPIELTNNYIDTYKVSRTSNVLFKTDNNLFVNDNEEDNE